MKWEYMVIKIRKSTYVYQISEMLNTHGADGWEFVWGDFGKNMFVFKRPKKDGLTTEEKKAVEGYFGGKIG